MSDYRIEKLRRHVSLVLINGHKMDGEVFLNSVSRHRSRPEEPADLLNDQEPFFALLKDGEPVFIAKSGVARAETSYQPSDEFAVVGLGVPVEVTMTDGSVCTGSIFVESRADRARLLDFLNAYRDWFLPVVDAQQVVLVNTRTIAHVREVA